MRAHGIVLLALVSPLAIAPMAPTPAQGNEHASADGRLLLESEALWMTAVRHRDGGELNRWMSGSFRLGRFGGSGGPSISRRVWIAGVLHSEETQSFDLDQPGTQIIGNIGIVTGGFHWIGTVDGVRFERQGRLIDTWERYRGNWHVISRILLE